MAERVKKHCMRVKAIKEMISDRDAVLGHVGIDGLLVRLDVERQGEHGGRHVLRQADDKRQLRTYRALHLVVTVDSIEVERLAHVDRHAA